MRTLCVVILAVLIVAVVARYPRYHIRDPAVRGPINPFEVRLQDEEAREFLKRGTCREPCYSNCMREYAAGNGGADCRHCGSDCV
ncbi:hypothetical protein ACROYT_G031099 [Oculina patagonica]